MIKGCKKDDLLHIVLLKGLQNLWEDVVVKWNDVIQGKKIYS